MSLLKNVLHYLKSITVVGLACGYFLGCHNTEEKKIQEPISDIERELSILMQIETQPERASSLCGKLSNASAKQRCLNIKMRPHLWYKQSALKADNRRQRGPSGRYLAPNLSPPPPPKPSKSLCDNGWTQNACREEEAVKANSTAEAMSACANLESKKWREECYFVAGEKRLQKRGVKQYGESVELCLLAQTYSANCLNHLAKVIAEKAKSAISDRQIDWEELIWSTQQVEAHWQEKDPLFGSATVDLIWALALDIAYEHAGIVAGNPLDYLPKGAKPHIHAAATYHLMRLEGVNEYDLKGWTARIGRALDARLKPTDAQARKPFSRTTIPTGWLSDKLGEDAIPAANYMTDGRRAISENDQIDIAICVVEAAARLPNGKKLLIESKNDSRPLVKWTANRLLGEPLNELNIK